MDDCADCRAKDERVRRLADHLTAASEVLGELARRDGRVAEIMRLRAALERIAGGGADAVAVAEEALRWTTKSS
jgi:hypothetical protein